MAMPFSKNRKKPDTSSRTLTAEERKYLAELGAKWEKELIKSSLRKTPGGVKKEK